jgi:hypothetical protein
MYVSTNQIDSNLLNSYELIDNLFIAIPTIDSNIVQVYITLTLLLMPSTLEFQDLKWKDVDLFNKYLTFNQSFIKPYYSRVLPLSEPAINELVKLKRITGHSEFVFLAPSEPFCAMSTNALQKAYRCIGSENINTLMNWQEIAIHFLNTTGWDGYSVKSLLDKFYEIDDFEGLINLMNCWAAQLKNSKNRASKSSALNELKITSWRNNVFKRSTGDSNAKSL